jgi:hypothetical protein
LNRTERTERKGFNREIRQIRETFFWHPQKGAGLVFQKLTAGNFRHTLGPMPAALLEHFQKNCSHSGNQESRSGLFEFWLRFGSVTGLFKPASSPKADDRHHSPKLKNPLSERLHFFFKRSKSLHARETTCGGFLGQRGILRFLKTTHLKPD